MTYDFDELINRRGTNSLKWDSAADPDVLPLWVADMDFRTAQPVIDALKRRVEHGIFGYTHVPDAFYESIIRWFARRHGWTMRREWMLYTSGVVPALGRHQGAHRTGRQGAGADARVQLFLLLYPQQRMHGGGKSPHL